jgi:hypothetical protein
VRARALLVVLPQARASPPCGLARAHQRCSLLQHRRSPLLPGLPLPPPLPVRWLGQVRCQDQDQGQGQGQWKGQAHGQAQSPREAREEQRCPCGGARRHRPLLVASAAQQRPQHLQEARWLPGGLCHVKRPHRLLGCPRLAVCVAVGMVVEACDLEHGRQLQDGKHGAAQRRRRVWLPQRIQVRKWKRMRPGRDGQRALGLRQGAASVERYDPL